MARLAELEARHASLDELDHVVGAMRALAAVRMRQAQEARRAARAYADAIRRALTAAQALVPPARDCTNAGALTIAFATEHGFTGAFNERVLDRAASLGAPMLVVGSRGLALAQDRRLNVIGGLAGPSHTSGVLDVASRIADELAKHPEAVVDAVYGVAATGTPELETSRLLPLPQPPASSALPPLHTLEPHRLIGRLTSELVLAELARIGVEAIAAESSARMQAMTSARDNIERKLDELERSEHRARQDQVTTELLELIPVRRA